ncbi:DUF6336 family protein [Streptomyces sp. NPDC048171]|uniref:DUF6336 family protein n=1 Tax=Streptomyces sp. NPDC048171 TaxID=3365504 RepID=UPI0037112161
MALDEDGVSSPRLRPVEVARRGGLLGLPGVVLLGVTTVSIADHGDREDFLALVGGLGLFGGILLVIAGGPVKPSAVLRNVSWPGLPCVSRGAGRAGR